MQDVTVQQKRLSARHDSVSAEAGVQKKGAGTPEQAVGSGQLTHSCRPADVIGLSSLDMTTVRKLNFIPVVINL
jgi:hypothetical protein